MTAYALFIMFIVHIVSKLRMKAIAS